MKKFKSLCTVLSILMILPQLTWGQESKTLTLEEAIKMGVDNSKQLKITGTKLDIAKAKREQYWNAQIPNVSLTSSYSRLSNNITPFSFLMPGSTEPFVLNPQILNQYTNRVSAQQILFSGLRATNFYKSSEFLEKAAALDVDKDRLEVKSNIVNAYYNLYKLQSSKKVLEENLRVLRGRYNDVQNFVKNGTALENDALKADLAISQVELTKKDVENAIEVANFNLDLMLGLNTNTRIEPDSIALLHEKNVTTLDSYLNSLDSRPDIASTEMRRQAALKSLEVVKGQMYPVISLNANYYNNRPNQRVFPQQDAFKATWDAGIQLSYNLSSLFTTKSQVKEAQANIVQVSSVKEQMTDGAKMEVSSSYFGYLSAVEKVTLIEKSINQATENQRVMKNKFDAQVIGISDLLDADYLVLQAKLNLAAAKADVETAYFKLLKATGKL